MGSTIGIYSHLNRFEIDGQVSFSLFCSLSSKIKGTLEQQFSRCGPGNTWELLRPFWAACNVKTIFITIIKHYLTCSPCRYFQWWSIINGELKLLIPQYKNRGSDTERSLHSLPQYVHSNKQNQFHLKCPWWSIKY